jgi:3-oxoacyl-[acyl-carrier protein] reductase
VGFSDYVILISGTRKGIGRHLATHFSALGAHVVGINRNPAPLDLERYEHHEADVADEGRVATIIRGVERAHGRVDALINNAGVAAMNHALLTPADSVERILRTNVVGTFVMSREAAKIMKKSNFGRMVNIGSVAVPMRIEGESAYAASKAAIVSLTRILARELAPFGITCNAVAPTPIETDLIAGVSKSKIQDIVDRLAIKRLGRVEDVANVVEFFLRPESDYITGQVLNLGGV